MVVAVVNHLFHCVSSWYVCHIELVVVCEAGPQEQPRTGDSRGELLGESAVAPGGLGGAQVHRRLQPSGQLIAGS